MTMAGEFMQISFRPGAVKSEAAGPKTLGPLDVPWSDGTVKTGAGEVPRVRTELLLSDRLGAWKARWAIGRMSYTVRPGLYAVGDPTGESPVFVSANYKLSFDSLRSGLDGLDAWVLVLDTRGINVWCAAGKGTFGTGELLRRIALTGLDSIVSHRTLVVPQLGAPGVSAHEVRKQSGFRVLYGPVRASDIKEFMASRMKATAGMRRVRFALRDRVVLIPVELVMGGRLVFLIAAGFFLLSGLGPGIYSLSNLRAAGPPSVLLFLTAFVGGTVLGPVLLPWLPGRAFSLKGAWIGLALVAALGYYAWPIDNWLLAASWALMIPAVSSYAVMNFTGASTYTSLSGVMREMRVAVPLQAAGAALGVGLWVGGRFIT